MDTLPNELLLGIFEWATFVPDAFYLGHSDLFINPTLPGSRDIQTALEHSLATKGVLVRICKRWRDLAMGILYRAVFVSDIDKARSLVETLQNSKGRLNGDHGYGWWTQRVDWVIRNALEDVYQSHLTVADALVEAICCFPNLVIFASLFASSSGRSGYPYSITMPSILLRTLWEVCGGSLLSFECLSQAGGAFLVQSEDVINLLGAIPYLQVLCCQHVTGLVLYDTPRLRSSALLFLTYNDGLSFLYRDPQYLPQLRHLSIIGRLSNPKEFLLIHGDKLSTISFSDWLNFRRIMQDTMMQFPQLSGLYLIIPDWRHIYLALLNVHLPPTVTSVGLQCVERKVSDNDYELLFERLSVIEAPKLEVVQFTCSWNISHMRTRPHILARGLSLVASRGVQVQDNEGRPLLEDGTIMRISSFHVLILFTGIR